MHFIPLPITLFVVVVVDAKREQIEEGRPAGGTRALGSLVETAQAFEVLVESFGLCAMVLDGAPVSADELLGLVQIFELLIALLAEFFQVAAVVVGIDEGLETMVEDAIGKLVELLGAGDGDVVECLVDGEQAHDVGLDGGGVAVKAKFEILEFGAEFVSDGDGFEMMPQKVQSEREQPGADAVVESLDCLVGALVDAIIDFAHGHQAALHHLIVVEVCGFLHGAHVEPLDAGEVEELGIDGFDAIAEEVDEFEAAPAVDVGDAVAHEREFGDQAAERVFVAVVVVDHVAIIRAKHVEGVLNVLDSRVTGEAIEKIGVFAGLAALEIVIDAAAKSLAVGDNEGVGVVDVVVDFVLCAVAQAVEKVCLINNGAPEGFVYDLCAESIVAVVLVGLAHGLLQRGFAEIGRRKVGAERRSEIVEA